MTVALYGSVNGQTKEIKKLYGSVSGQTKRIRKLYGSVPITDYYPTTNAIVDALNFNTLLTKAASEFPNQQAKWDALTLLTPGEGWWYAYLKDLDGVSNQIETSVNWAGIKADLANWGVTLSSTQPSPGTYRAVSFNYGTQNVTKLIFQDTSS